MWAVLARQGVKPHTVLSLPRESVVHPKNDNSGNILNMLNSNIFFPINDLLSVGRKYITTRSFEKLHTLLNFSIKNMKIIHHMYSQHTKHRDSEAPLCAKNNDSPVKTRAYLLFK